MLNKEISMQSFIDELHKLATIYHDSNGNVLYKSEDAQTTNVIKQDPKNGTEQFTEDSDFGKKIAALAEGFKYPSEESKKEYDAATDNVHEDLDAAINNSPAYPVDHHSLLKVALYNIIMAKK